MNNKIIQIIDANFNRVREGLRVVEDGIRFYISNRDIFKQVKDFRHKFTRSILENFPSVFLHKGRDILKDTGKNYDIIKKENIKKTIEKNCLRVEEGIRVIEEYSKCLKPSISKKLHNLRFEFYRIEKEITTLLSRKNIPVPLIYVIINANEKKDVIRFTEEIIKGKPDIIQLRYKGENTNYFLKIAKKLKNFIPDEIIYIINDRIDICLLVDADGVHLGEKDIGVEDARKLLEDKIIGVSSNSFNEAAKYKNKDIDYIAIGAIFQSPTKPERKIAGLKVIKEIKKNFSIPVVAIGGINKENVSSVIKEGADGVALISAVEKAGNKHKYIKQIKDEVETQWKKKNRMKRKNR